MWLGQKERGEDVPIQKSKVDRVMGVKKPVFKKQYHPTKLNSSYVFHSISMMMVGMVKLITLFVAGIFQGRKNFCLVGYLTSFFPSNFPATLYDHCSVILWCTNYSIIKIIHSKNFVCLLLKSKGILIVRVDNTNGFIVACRS